MGNGQTEDGTAFQKKKKTSGITLSKFNIYGGTYKYFTPAFLNLKVTKVFSGRL